MRGNVVQAGGKKLEPLSNPATASDIILGKEVYNDQGNIIIGGIDTSGSPGSKVLIAGDGGAGFYGEVSPTELISYNDLATACTLTEGVGQNLDTPYLKFSYNGNILFVAKKPVRHSISHYHLSTKSSTVGNRTIVINGLTYKIRLLKACNVSSPSSSSGAINRSSEWNRLLLPIHVEAENKNWRFPNNVEADVPYWGVNYTDADLGVNTAYGGRVWCQEKQSPTNYTFGRGSLGITHSSTFSPTSKESVYGWRPVLELVP